MRSIIIGITFSCVSVLTIILLFISYREGGLFYLKDMWTSLLDRLSSISYVTKQQFDSMLDKFDYIRDFKAPSFSDGIWDALKDIFNLIKNVVGVLFNILGMFVGLIVDSFQLVTSFGAAISEGWREGANPIVL